MFELHNVSIYILILYSVEAILESVERTIREGELVTRIPAY